MKNSFLSHQNYRYLWIALALGILSMALYIVDSQFQIPNGGTWLGYTLGTLGAVIIVLLSYLGIRKRQFNSQLGTVKGWVSAHVYLGLLLIIVTTLHSGFQFHWNVHLLTYTLMMSVIFTGTIGIYVYRKFPQLITQNRGELNNLQMIEELKKLDDDALTLADSLDKNIYQIMLRSTQRSQVGGGLWSQLFPSNHYGKFANDIEQQLDNLAQQGTYLGRLDETRVGVNMVSGLSQVATEFFMVDQLVSEGDEEKVLAVRQLLDQIQQKRLLLGRLQKNIQLQAWMEIWLYVHIPLSVGLLASLFIHIFTVFFYR